LHHLHALLDANRASPTDVTTLMSVGGFQNTPMEGAIRECIEKATAHVVGSTPPTYFHHS
jgi:hypothetical protein